jgi:hypothetical protein
MRKWKSEHDPQTRVFLYFQEHPNKFFNARHVASQVRIGRIKVKGIIEFLEALGKLEGVHCVTSKLWGRPRTLYRCMRGGPIHDSIPQVEAFKGDGQVIPNDRPPIQADLVSPR